MAASGFSLEAVKNFMIENDCKVTNHELVTHFKSYLNDPIEKCKFLVMNFPLFSYICVFLRVFVDIFKLFLFFGIGFTVPCYESRVT